MVAAEQLPTMALKSPSGFKFDKTKDAEYMPVNEYVEKPVKPEVLLDKISKALGK